MSQRIVKNKRDDEGRVDAKVAFLQSTKGWETLCVSGYTSLDQNPAIMAACYKIASMIGQTTIHLMENSESGDKRIINELSRKIDINPTPNMTRQTWLTAIVMAMLLYGEGNAIVVPHTKQGYLDDLEFITPSRVMLRPKTYSYTEYEVIIDGIYHKNPEDLLHFVYNPDELYPWKGKGMTVSLKDVAANLKQAATTEKAFMASEYKPSIIVKVDALTDEFSGPEGRKKLLDSYVKPETPGQPWLIPSEQFSVEQVKPLTLADLAINDTVEIDKRAVASIIGVPPFVVGVGSYNKDEWNYFIQTTIMPIAKSIAAELTKKLILKPEWYLTFNIWSLMDYDLRTVSSVLLDGSDRGYVNGDEWRDRMHLSPAGLTEYRVLENYIPSDMSGKQKKLIQGD